MHSKHYKKKSNNKSSQLFFTILILFTTISFKSTAASPKSLSNFSEFTSVSDYTFGAPNIQGCGWDFKSAGSYDIFAQPALSGGAAANDKFLNFYNDGNANVSFVSLIANDRVAFRLNSLYVKTGSGVTLTVKGYKNDTQVSGATKTYTTIGSGWQKITVDDVAAFSSITEIRIEGITSPSFAIDEIQINQTVLPVNLLFFNLTQKNSSTKLLWEVALEDNCAYYTLERSIDGIVFTKFATIQPKGSNSKYEYQDFAQINAAKYYRLSQTDIDGAVNILGVIASSNPLTNINNLIYPSPAVEYIELSFLNPSKRNIVKLTDLSGKLVKEEKLSIGKTQLTGLGKLPSGVYILHANNMTFKIIKK